MTDNYTEEENALRVYFETTWADATEVHYPNTEFTPPNGEPWVRFNIQGSDARQASMAAATTLYRGTGMLTFQIFVPKDEGTKRVNELADTIVEMFRGYSAAGITFREPPFKRNVGPDDVWYQVNVVAAFERDSFL